MIRITLISGFVKFLEKGSNIVPKTSKIMAPKRYTYGIITLIEKCINYNSLIKSSKMDLADFSLKGLLLFTIMVLGKTITPRCSNCIRNVDKNLAHAPPLCVPMRAFLFEKSSLKLSVITDNHVITFVSIGGEPPLYSGAQKINPSACLNF